MHPPNRSPPYTEAKIRLHWYKINSIFTELAEAPSSGKLTALVEVWCWIYYERIWNANFNEFHRFPSMAS
jgi:hypothetical protein